MDLALTEIQTLLQNSAREFLEAEMPKSRVLEIDDSESGFAVEIWEMMCEIGWAGMVIPEEYGGSGNTFTDLGIVQELMGFYACPSPLLSSAVLCSQAILEAGDDAQKQALLPSIASGQQIFAFAFTEPDYGWGPGTVQLPRQPKQRQLRAQREQAVHPGRQRGRPVCCRRPHFFRRPAGPGRYHVGGGQRLPRHLSTSPDRLDRPQGLRGRLLQCGSL